MECFWIVHPGVQCLSGRFIPNGGRVVSVTAYRIVSLSVVLGASLYVGLVAIHPAAQAGSSDGQTLTIRGDAPPVCSLPEPHVTSGDGSPIDTEAQVLAASANSQAPERSIIRITYPEVTCNYPARELTLRFRYPLPKEAGGGEIKLPMVNLSMSVTWGSLVAERVHSSNPVAHEFFFPSGKATRGDLIITIRGTSLHQHSLKHLMDRSWLNLHVRTRI